MRTCVIFLVFCLCSVCLGIRLFYLQIVQGPRYTQLAQNQRMRPTTIDARRGNIYDRNYQTLAMSVGAQAVYAVPSQTRDSVIAAAQMAPYLSLCEEEIASLLAQSRTVWLDRKLAVAEAEAIMDLKIPGIRTMARPQRFYPQGTLAAHVLGFAGVDNQGLEGLEFFYDDILSGVAGRIHREQDATQKQIPGGIERIEMPQHGYDLVLTIDSVVQYIAEREIESAVVGTSSDRGVILMIDPKTGAILANAIYPTFDPNDFASSPTSDRRNVVITDQFEPGSTFKIITAAAALDQNVTSTDRLFHSGPSWRVGGGVVHSWNGHGHGDQTFVRVLENSDNIAFAKLSVEMEPHGFHPYIWNFGFGQRSGVDFPGESRGTLPSPGQLRHGETLQWANIGFGQGVAVTALQLTAAVGAVANNGVLMRPHYVNEVRDQDGKVMARTRPTVLSQPITTETAHTMVELLRSVVVNGTGARADIVGFQVAGKTGTAEVPEKGRYGDNRIASFVGFAPADDPQVVALVALYNPKTEVRYGGVLAAPVFQKVMEQTLEYLGVRRRKESTQRTQMVVVPNIRNFPRTEAVHILRESNLRPMEQGEGTVILDQIPTPGSRVPPQTVVNLFFHNDEERRFVMVPSILGRSMRDASMIITEADLRIRVVGSGMAVKQTPTPGTKVPLGSVVEVEFGQQVTDRR